MGLDASTVILGFTGSIGSGCTYISDFVSSISEKKYKYYKLSQTLRDHLKSSGAENPTVEELQDLGNELRRKKGNGVLVNMLLEDISEDPDVINCDGIIIDGIKNQGEFLSLRQFPYFYVFSVISNTEIRCKRCIENGVFKSEEDFYKADIRDKFEDCEYGQQVKPCSDLADVVIINNEIIPKASVKKKKDYIRKSYDRYIKLIENLTDGKQSEDIKPTIAELCMTMAYSLSKMSSCVKRKVGAVIVDVMSSNGVKEGNSEQVLDMPFVVSSGYNEVPMGSYKCIFHPDYEMCYRDSIQQNHANKIKYCPNCGTAIELTSTCDCCGKEYEGFVKFCSKCRKEINVNFQCKKCKSNVFEEYLPGGKESPSKLLDLSLRF